MTRVLFLHHTATIGGAEMQLLSVARHFRERSLVVLFGDGLFRNALEKNGVHVRVFPSAWAAQGLRGGAPNFSVRNLAAVLRLAWQTARAAGGADLIVANSPRALFVAAIAGLVRRKRIVWIMHDLLDETHFHPRGIQLIVRVANRGAARVIADSKANADAFLGAGGRADLVRIVYCGVPAVPLTEPKQKRVSTIGVFGRITPWKGHEVVLGALAQTPQINAIFVGAGEDSDYARGLGELANELGLTNRIRFLGFREDVAELMREVDCVVHASIAPEPFGLVIVEGMLAQRPVIATRAGGAVEIIEDGESGLLVRPGDAAELAAAINTISANPAEAARLARNGYDRARLLFSEERLLRETEQQFREVVSA